MDIMMGMSTDAFLIALVQIIAIDIVLGGDNAIIIALACRNLPPKQKRLGIIWGTAGAIILRVILVFFASALMTTPGLRLVTTAGAGKGQHGPRMQPTDPTAAWRVHITYITTINSNTTPKSRSFRQADHIDQQRALVSWQQKRCFQTP